MTRFLIIRHGVTDVIGRTITGRLPGVHLTAAGKKQVERLARKLSSVSIDAVVSSPMERALETARPIAELLGREVEVSRNLNEVDYGDWTGRDLSLLENDPLWIRYNRFRAGVAIPGGEHMFEIQARMCREVERIYTQSPDAVVALVSHADPIRILIAAFAGIPMQYVISLEISPAFVSVLSVYDHDAQIHNINQNINPDID